MKDQRKSYFLTKRGSIVFYLSSNLLIGKIINGHLEAQPIADVFSHLCNCDKTVPSYLCTVFFSITRNLS